MPSNKDRLYIALYARGTPGTYHWALIVGPKIETERSEGKRYHVKEQIKPNRDVRWTFEEEAINLRRTNRLLVRVLIGKVKNKVWLEDIFRNVPIKGDEPGWDCTAWVKEALEAIHADGNTVGTSVLDWQQVRNAAISYVQTKIDTHRFDGQGNFDITQAATYDLLEDKETVP